MTRSLADIRESACRVLTPMMQDALTAMGKGGLERTPDGWMLPSGKGPWNSHTIDWLAFKQFCCIEGNRAVQTRHGRETLVGLQGWAA
jgi:hypothetical protein